MEPLPSAALKVIVPVYWPEASELEATVTVSVACSPEVSVVVEVTLNQEALVVSVLAVIVTLPAQVPLAARVNVCVGVAGFAPALAVKASPEDETGPNSHGGGGACTVTLTVIVVLPTTCIVELSSATTVMVPVYVPALRLNRLALIVSVELAEEVSVPMGVTLSQELLPIEGVAVQSNVSGQ
jgi:hypothetical protein